MPITVTKQREYDCALASCDNTRTRTSTVAGSFCSQECADRHDGQNLLTDLRQDHRVCWSCFRLRKEIERPTAEARRGLGPITDDALQGYQYLTEHVEMGDHGLECTCGAVDHQIDGWDQREDAPYHWYLKLIVEEISNEGQTNKTLDIATFADTYWESDGDLELALGRALTDSSP